MSNIAEVIILLNVIYLASAIEHQSSRSRHSLRVTVSPKESVIRPGESIVVECQVNSGERRDHFPSIGIYLQLERNTVLPLTSDLPGITVSTVAVAGTQSKYGRHSKSITYVTIGEEMYHVMHKVENHFVCTASTPAGEYRKEYFTVWKVPYSSD